MTAYDNIRLHTGIAEQEAAQLADDLADAKDMIAAQSNEIEELRKALAECEGGGPPDPPTGGIGPLLQPPAGKVYVGVQQEENGLTIWNAEAGRPPHIYHRYANSAANVASAIQGCPKGMIPLINYKPAGQMGLTAYNSILNGNQNTSIDQTADHIKAYGKPMWLAPMHEPENDGTAADDPKYAAAYRYIIERIRARGVTNMVSVWNMMGAAIHGARYTALYPGDDVVDWLAADLYIISNANVDTWGEFLNQAGWPTSPSGWYNWAKAKGKPLMLAEWGIGTAVVPATPTKMFGTTEMNNLITNYPLLKALVYWNAPGIGGYQVSNSQWTGSGPSGLLGTWVARPEFQIDISQVAK